MNIQKTDKELDDLRHEYMQSGLYRPPTIKKEKELLWEWRVLILQYLRISVYGRDSYDARSKEFLADLEKFLKNDRSER